MSAAISTVHVTNLSQSVLVINRAIITPRVLSSGFSTAAAQKKILQQAYGFHHPSSTKLSLAYKPSVSLGTQPSGTLTKSFARFCSTAKQDIPVNEGTSKAQEEFMERMKLINMHEQEQFYRTLKGVGLVAGGLFLLTHLKFAIWTGAIFGGIYFFKRMRYFKHMRRAQYYQWYMNNAQNGQNGQAVPPPPYYGGWCNSRYHGNNWHGWHGRGNPWYNDTFRNTGSVKDAESFKDGSFTRDPKEFLEHPEVVKAKAFWNDVKKAYENNYNTNK